MRMGRVVGDGVVAGRGLRLTSADGVFIKVQRDRVRDRLTWRWHFERTAGTV